MSLLEGALAVYWQSPAAGAMRLTARGCRHASVAGVARLTTVAAILGSSEIVLRSEGLSFRSVNQSLTQAADERVS